jgi:hypothetical protein
MTVQPKYHWQFEERQGTRAVDVVSGVKATLSKAELNGHGRIDNAVHLFSKDSHVNLGKEVGQFGTSDFTVAFGMKNISTHGDSELDIIGDQTMQSHGNFFSVRLQKQRIFFHVDENSKAKHYVRILTDPLPMIASRTWFHVAVVRAGQTLKIYIDGALAAEGASETGVANINNEADVKLGHSRRGTPNAQYEDLRIYHTALSAAEVNALVSPVNRPLREGEIELVATDKTAVILKQDVEDLSHFSTSFKELRVGKNTGVTLYQQKNFEGTAQRCYADLPDIQLSLLESFPGAIRIWSAVGEPFTGKWVIKAPNGQFLSLSQSVLSTAPQRSFRELVRFHYNLHQGQLQLLPGSPQEGAALKVSPVAEATPLFVEELENLTDEFFITNQTKSQWLELGEDDTFNWTVQKEKRAIFVRVAKRAANENHVGELATGEVALYKHRAYYGAVWILSDSEKDQFGSYKRLADFEDLNDQTSSIRLGPNTGVTLFRHFDHQAAEDKGEEEIEDIVENVPRLSARQIGQDNLSSLQIFRTISPEDVFTSYTTKLSQDYRLVDNKLEEFSAYRTTLRFEPGAGEIEVSATDLTTIEVDSTTHEIDEARSVTLSPNELNFIMITSEADGLNTPGLKIRTSEMAENDQVVIFPNQEVHQQIAELEDDALWNAKDAQGNLIVDRTAHSQAEVASVQNTIKRVMATVTYTDDAPVVRKGSVANSRIQSSNQVVSGATIDNPWELKFGSNEANKTNLPDRGRTPNPPSKVILKVPIEENKISPDEWQQLLSQAASGDEASSLVAARSGFGRIGKKFKDTIKKGTSVVIGTVKDVVHVIVKTAEGIIDFVVDTAEKVAEFVEAVVEKVVSGIKKFIEFLQFLFNWGDILDTQKYLVQAINDGFDYVAQQVEAVKAPVSNFMDELQETVEDAMNQLVTTLGGDPSEASKSDSGLPEAAEWFLSKLLGGSKQEDAEPTPKSVTPPSGNSQTENFVFHFTEALEEVAGAASRAFAGLGETIATIIANPLKPQLALIVVVETLRDVVIQMLEAIEHLVLGFLDAIAEAVEQIKKLLNAEIKIPFISDLFRLIGGGKLTLLNLTSLLLAIPVTVVSKLVFGKNPFKNEPPLNFAPSANDRLVAEPTGGLLVTEPNLASLVTESVESDQKESNSARKKSVRIWGIIGLFADALNGLINAGLDVSAENENPERVLEANAGFGLEIVSLGLSGFSWLASFPSSPDGFPGGRPYNVAAHPVSKSKDEQEYWERVMWGWRTALYWLDVAILAGKGIANALGENAKLQRLRRTDLKSSLFVMVASVVDMGLTGKYLSTIPEEDKSDLEELHEIVAWLPNFLAPMRGDSHGAKRLAVIDFVAMVVNTGSGSKLLKDDLAEL